MLATAAVVAVLAGCAAEDGTPPVTVDDPENLLTVTAPPVMRDALAALDRAWTAEGNDPLRIDFAPPSENTANHLRAALTAAAPEPVPADVVLTDNEATRESAQPSLWTDAGVVAATELLLLVPADSAAAERVPELPAPLEGSLAVCGAHCGERADAWLRETGATDSVTRLPVPGDVVDHVTQVRAEDYAADLPAGSGERAVTAVVEREADLALTYAADAHAVRGDDAWPDDKDFVRAPLPGAPRVEITALVSEGRDADEAAAFVAFLKDGAGAEILVDSGFGAP